MVAVNIVIAGNLVFPDFLDGGVHVPGAQFTGAVVAVHGHVRVGDVMAEHEEHQGGVVGGGGEGGALFLALDDAQVVDHRVGEGFAALRQVVHLVDGVGFVVQGGGFTVLVEQGPGGQDAEFLEDVPGRSKFHDVAGAVVLDDLIRVPGAADDAVLVGVEPLDEVIGEGAVLRGNFHILQAFNGFESDPGMGKFFHFAPPQESREPRTENPEPRAENRNPRAEKRKPRTENRELRNENQEPRTEKRKSRIESRLVNLNLDNGFYGSLLSILHSRHKLESNSRALRLPRITAKNAVSTH